MNVYALLSWFDEKPEHLRRCVRSLAGFADCIVAVDGPYATFEHTDTLSPSVQHWTLSDTVRTSGLRPFLVTPAIPYDSEVQKRAEMFQLGREAGATADDWFLIIDADMTLAEFTPEARDLLAASDRDVAEVRWQDMMVNGMPLSTNRFRSMFRALPGLTVERTHYLYTVPCLHCERCEFVPCAYCHGTGRRFPWHKPNGHLSDELIVDLFGHVTLHHFNSQRDNERKQRALAYYADRDARTLESAGDWR